MSMIFRVNELYKHYNKHQVLPEEGAFLDFMTAKLPEKMVPNLNWLLEKRM